VKSISTLVQDIYSLLEKGAAKIDASNLGQMISGRLREVKGGPALRMSTAGEKCVRKLWFRQHQPETAEALPGPTVLKFMTGDIKEELVLSLAEQAGHKVEARQEEVEYEGVKGHIDAIIDGVVVDVKSANSRSMEKFRRHQLERLDPFGYLDQIGLYAEALKDDPRVTVKGQVAFLAADKELGHLHLDVYPKRERPWKDILRGIKDELSKSTPPDRYYSDRPDGASGNRSLPMECTYCSYKEVCWRDANGGRGLRKFIYANGPKWFTRIMREPDVPEKTSIKNTQE
jgi:CRISPR/Cas system-associated exonuclease Cas4 (RecB family)